MRGLGLLTMARANVPRENVKSSRKPVPWNVSVAAGVRDGKFLSLEMSGRRGRQQRTRVPLGTIQTTSGRFLGNAGSVCSSPTARPSSEEPTQTPQPGQPDAKQLLTERKRETKREKERGEVAHNRIFSPANIVPTNCHFVHTNGTGYDR